VKDEQKSFSDEIEISLDNESSGEEELAESFIEEIKKNNEGIMMKEEDGEEGKSLKD